MDSKVARKWCGSVLELPYSSYPIYRRGTPNSSDIAALEILVEKSKNPAFLKCEKDFLVDCVKRLQNNAIAINSIQKTSKGYLIDLGADSSLWQEGLFWKERGCKVNKKGGSKTRDMTDGNGFTQRYRWFRQGWCKDQTIYGSK